MTTDKPIPIGRYRGKPAALYVAIITGMKYCWHELEGTGMSGGETSLSLNPSEAYLAPLVGGRPHRPKARL